MYEQDDKELAENSVENALQLLRSREMTSTYRRNMARKVIRNELTFLQAEHPSSYVLKLDITDVSLELE